MGRVDGKVVIISGGASGLGLASAKRLAEEGATVIIGDINQALGEQVASKIANVHFEHLDVTKEANWERLIDKVVST
jgi:NAD(P)-dependent dehydrogenase (short-subunit alcohol dehydrogenase family)